MSPKHKLSLLFTPSWISLLIGIILSVATVGTTSFLLAQHSGRLGNFNIGDYVSATGINTVGTLIKSFFSSLRFNTFFSILFWVLIGFITYNVVYLFRGSVDESVTFFQTLHYVHAKPSSMRRRLALRITLLIISMGFWVFFAFVFSWDLLPMILSLVNRSITEGGSPIYVILAFLLSLFVTHIAAILLRFTLLKARISSTGE
jgi:hypothetical protein